MSENAPLADNLQGSESSGVKAELSTAVNTLGGIVSDDDVNAGHVTYALESLRKQDQQAFDLHKASEITKRWAIGAVLIFIAMVLIYGSVTQDTTLVSQILVAIAIGLGGFGFGIYFGGRAEKKLRHS